MYVFIHQQQFHAMLHVYSIQNKDVKATTKHECDYLQLYLRRHFSKMKINSNF